MAGLSLSRCRSAFRESEPVEAGPKPHLLANSSANKSKKNKLSPTGERHPCNSPSPHAIPRRKHPPPCESLVGGLLASVGDAANRSSQPPSPRILASMVGKRSTDNMTSWTPEEDRKILQLYALEARPPSKRHHSRPSI